MSGSTGDMPPRAFFEQGQGGNVVRSDSDGSGRHNTVQDNQSTQVNNPQQSAKSPEQLSEDGKPRGKKRRRRRQRGRQKNSQSVNAVDNSAVLSTTGNQPHHPQNHNAQPHLPNSSAKPAQFGHGGARQQGSAQAHTKPKYQETAFAALDLGTNNCRLLVAQPTRPGQFRVVDSFSRIVRLGEGLSLTGRLSDAAMDRAVDAIAVCANKLKVRPIKRQRLIATEACRSAENGQEFLDRVLDRTGLELEIVSRETEAKLAVAGCASLVERNTPAIVIFDIGGGSTEIALCDLSARRTTRLDTHIKDWTSLPVGVVSLAEKFGGRDVSRQAFADMVGHVTGLIDAFEGRNGLAHILGNPLFHLLGTSGTVTTLGGLHLKLERYDRKRIDGLWIDNQAIETTLDELLDMSFDERVSNVCIGQDRADLVLPGCAILEAIRLQWPSDRLRVADRGLREGLLTELMVQDGAWRRGPKRKWHGTKSRASQNSNTQNAAKSSQEQN